MKIKKVKPYIDQKPKVILPGLVLFAVLSVLFYLFYSILAENNKERFLTKSEKAILYKDGKHEKALLKIQEDLYFLSHLNSIQNWTTNPAVSKKDLLEFLKMRPNYDQLRILDTLGQEVFLLNNDDSIKSVERLRLAGEPQKLHSNQAFHLNSGEYYVSPISLKKENGQVEVPFKPVFRITTPIFKDSVKNGYICINYKLKHLLQKIEHNKVKQSQFDLIDSRNTLLSSLVGSSPPKELISKSKTLIHRRSKKEGKIDLLIGDQYMFMATPLEWSDNYSSDNNKNPKIATNSNQLLTLIYYFPKSAMASVNEPLAKIFLLSYSLFAVLYFISLWYVNIQRKKSTFSQIQFQSIFNKTSTFIGLLEPDGTLIEANDTALSFGGFTREQAKGQKFWDAPWWSLNDAIRTQLKKAIYAAREGKRIRYDVNVVGGSGEVITIDFSLNPVLNQQGEVIYIIPEGKDVTEKQQLQSEVEEKKNQYEAIQKISRTGFWKVDIKTNSVDWDQMVYEIHEEPPGKQINVAEGIQYYRKDYQPIISAVIDEAIQKNEPWDVEAVLVTASGNEKWVHTIGYPVFKNGALTELRGTFRDIDDRKKLELQVIENDRLLRLALKAGGLGTWDWDIVNNTLKWDETMYELYDVDRNAFSSDFEAWEKTLHPDDQIKATEKVEEAVQTTGELDVSFRIITRNQEVRHIKANAKVITGDDGQPIRMIGFNIDISSLSEANQKIHELNQSLEEKVKLRTEELRNAKTELEQQLELIGKAALVSETNLKGEIVHANQTFCEISGYTLEELQNNSHSILNSGMQSVDLYKDLWLTITNGNTWQSELCNKKKNGELYWVHATIQPFYDKNGKIIRYTGVFFDITEQKEATRRLSMANKMLDAANKELETFSYSVSHDLKAPLRALQGFSKNLVEKYETELDDTGVRWLHFIRDNASRMDTLIADILSFSRINKTQPKFNKFDMRSIVEEKVATIQQIYPAPSKVCIADDLPNINSDKTMMEVVWQNLIDNAFKYSQKESEVAIKVWGKEDRHGVTYFIRDNGAGFDMKYYDKIFGVFQRLHSNDEFEGTGVGLANVSRIITKHNGAIEAESETNKGATFHFFIPKNY